ncbi:uncharacterized protein RCO7_08226 [Rhynchosporium graminicola]|uniref:NADH:ubiquinone oxidoreductase 20.1kD subunit n=1 Tax=Rhynchosporium graminicola TaxID=2792576 RepID=A0A1E1LCZ1_9HELO|nr:uncharacterized protein RCO7_08226 [Rhynchosporium commune]
MSRTQTWLVLKIKSKHVGFGMIAEIWIATVRRERSIRGPISEMLTRRIAAARPLRNAFPVVRRTAINQQRGLVQQLEPIYPKLTEAEDPGMNGGYINPPPIKRQFRDPHADWWDKQERRNYGEPVHEDNDILGMFSPEEYTHTTPGKGLFQIGCFVAVVLGLCTVVGMTYPDKQSAPREFEGGLERELGGPDALRARAPGDE